MSNSLLLTTKSLVTFILPNSTSVPAALDSGVASFSNEGNTFFGTVTWSITTDSKNTIKGNKVVLSINNIVVSAYTASYPNPVPGTGSLAASKITKIKMNNKIPMCVADEENLSIDINAYYIDSDGDKHYIGKKSCTCKFNAVQTVTSGLIAEPETE